MQVTANRNWEDMGMDVPRQLAELEDPDREALLRDAEYSMPVNRARGA